MYQSIGDTMTARKIYQSYFTKNKSAVMNREWNLQDIAKYLILSMEIDLPQKEVIGVMEDLIKSESNPFLRDQFKQILAIAYLRMGESKIATKLLPLEPSRHMVSKCPACSSSPAGTKIGSPT